MALFKCSECGNDVSLDAKQCPKCGTPKPFKKQVLSVEESKKLSYSERIRFQKSGGKIKLSKIQIFSGIFLVIFFTIFFRSMMTTPDISKNPIDKNKDKAVSSCRSYINQQLNDPDSAKYGMGSMDIAVVETDGIYTVRRNLRAKNGFGAMVRSTFECQFKEGKDGLDLLSLREVK